MRLESFTELQCNSRVHYSCGGRRARDKEMDGLDHWKITFDANTFFFNFLLFWYTYFQTNYPYEDIHYVKG